MEIRSILCKGALCMVYACAAGGSPAPGGGDRGVGREGPAPSESPAPPEESACATSEPCTRETSFDECEAVAFEAEATAAPVDIVWVIDSSSSMSEEAGLIQQNMNHFVEVISSTGLDVRVVLMTAQEFVSVPAPLGTDPEKFLFVDQAVSSTAALELADSEFRRYGSFLRDDASTNFVLVSDHDSAMEHSAFQSSMTGKLGKPFRAHTIASPPGSTHERARFGTTTNAPGCSGTYGSATANGEEYWVLAEDTGGERFSICTPDWSGLFETLSSILSIPEGLPCTFDVPQPPEGLTFDPLQVNVVFTPEPGADEETIPFVGSRGACDGAGWFYGEGEATRVEACPATCAELESSGGGRVDIAFGCETIVI